MMELNKYDLVEYLALILKNMPCLDCPLKEECDEKERHFYFTKICNNKDETRELLIKKYNL